MLNCGGTNPKYEAYLAEVKSYIMSSNRYYQGQKIYKSGAKVIN